MLVQLVALARWTSSSFPAMVNDAPALAAGHGVDHIARVSVVWREYVEPTP